MKKRRKVKARLEEKRGFEVRVGVMFEAAEEVAAPELWLGVTVEERFWVLTQGGSAVVTPLVVASSLRVSLSFSSPPLASPSAPPQAAASDFSPKASPHPPFYPFPLSTSFPARLSPLRSLSLPHF